MGILIFKISDEWPYQRSEIVKDSNAWDFEMWPLAVLTGDPINEGFFIRKLMAVLPAAKITWPQ